MNEARFAYTSLNFISTEEIYERKQLEHKGRAIAQAVSRRLPTAAALVQIRVWSCGILG
jgi:hypothetical protein